MPSSTSHPPSSPVNALSIEELLDPHRRFTSEVAYQVARLSPLNVLPARVLQARHSRLQPPLFHFGWLLDLEKCRILAMTRQFSGARLDGDSDTSSDDTPNEDMDEDEDEDEDAEEDWEAYLTGGEYLSEETRACIRESIRIRLCEDITSKLMQKLGLWNTCDDFVQAVLAILPSEPNSKIQLALSVGDNFHLNDLPRDEVLDQIKKEFEFDCDAGWFMDAIDTAWTRK